VFLDLEIKKIFFSSKDENLSLLENEEYMKKKRNCQLLWIEV